MHFMVPAQTIRSQCCFFKSSGNFHFLVTQFCCLVCDPVMGDEGKLYVPKELVSVYREKVLSAV